MSAKVFSYSYDVSYSLTSDFYGHAETRGRGVSDIYRHAETGDIYSETFILRHLF